MRARDRRLLELTRGVLAGTHAITVRVLKGEERLAVVKMPHKTPPSVVLSRELSRDVLELVGEGFGDGVEPRWVEDAAPTLPDAMMPFSEGSLPAQMMAVLSSEPQPVASLVEATGMKSKAARNALDRLVSLGLVVKSKSEPVAGQKRGRVSTFFRLR